MKNQDLIWFSKQLAEHEKRYIDMMINDLNEIEKMPVFSVKGKIKAIKKKYLEMKSYHK